MDEQAQSGITAEERQQQEREDRKLAEEQAARDVEAAKRLVAEKLEKEKLDAERKAEAARLEQIRLEEEKREAEAQEKARLEKAKLEAERKAAEKAALEAASAKEATALKLKLAKEQETRDLKEAKEAAERLATEKREAEALAAQKAETVRLEESRLEKEREALEAKAAAELKAKQGAQEQKEKEAQKVQEEKVARPPKAEPEPAPKPTPAPEDDPKKPGFLQRISSGLKKSTNRMSDNVSAIFNKRKLDTEALEELEDLLIASDLGVGPAQRTTQLLAKDKFDKQVTGLEIKIALADVIAETLAPLEKPIILGDTKPQIMLFVGVNGSGKTTTLGKLASRYTGQGKKVLLAAGDTFRAAAVEQLKIWGERAGAPVVSADLGADAAGLVYDAIARAKAENYDILMIDTAGRLQNRTELMDELAKIVRVIKKQDETAPHHSLLVLDATVGQNALSQTEAFEKTAGITGLIMTKLDGTAKGGVLVALADQFKLPIHAIGIGERIEDLENFSAAVFAAALSGVADAVIDDG
ncbi:MAG: signal recognition particle-docking protein FtsY [Robiginitomaculum sp.]|nr:MAG: signal recognition particle-docking protein FtsY [Robiginitomaculum sp.]